MLTLIVEGKSDVTKLNMVLKPSVRYITLNGINFKEEQALEIKKALAIGHKVYIMTDPDEAGNRVAHYISGFFPFIDRIKIDPKQARIMQRKEKKSTYKYGVEFCSNAYLRSVFEEHAEIKNLLK